MKKKWMALFLSLSMLAVFTACGNNGPTALYELKGKEAGKLGLPVAETQDETLTEGVNRFAMEFYDRLEDSGNVFFSPYSICGAISLLDVGAGGETKAELEQMLGIADLNAWNQQMKLFMEKDWGGKAKILTANSLWISPAMQKSENIETDFLQPAAFYYKSEVFEADFAQKGEETVKAINKWVDKNTQGMIPKYKDKVDSGTVMMILNAVYFEGKWALPFKPENTLEDGIFINREGEKKQNIPMMHLRNKSFRYMETGELKGIQIPYKDSSMVMEILLPLDETSTKAIDLYRALSNEAKADIWSTFEEAAYETVSCLAMPRFTMDLEVKGMDMILQDMGMLTAYEEYADFDAIGEALYVDSVAHRAKIEVDEEGTKAAAVTEIANTEGAMITEPEKVEFIMDRPFVFVIRDTDTGIILFMGQVADL